MVQGHLEAIGGEMIEIGENLKEVIMMVVGFLLIAFILWMATRK